MRNFSGGKRGLRSGPKGSHALGGGPTGQPPRLCFDLCHTHTFLSPHAQHICLTASDWPSFGLVGHSSFFFFFFFFFLKKDDNSTPASKGASSKHPLHPFFSRKFPEKTQPPSRHRHLEQPTRRRSRVPEDYQRPGVICWKMPPPKKNRVQVVFGGMSNWSQGRKKTVVDGASTNLGE